MVSPVEFSSTSTTGISRSTCRLYRPASAETKWNGAVPLLSNASGTDATLPTAVRFAPEAPVTVTVLSFKPSVNVGTRYRKTPSMVSLPTAATQAPVWSSVRTTRTRCCSAGPGGETLDGLPAICVTIALSRSVSLSSPSINTPTSVKTISQSGPPLLLMHLSGFSEIGDVAMASRVTVMDVSSGSVVVWRSSTVAEPPLKVTGSGLQPEAGLVMFTSTSSMYSLSQFASAQARIVSDSAWQVSPMPLCSIRI